MKQLQQLCNTTDRRTGQVSMEIPPQHQSIAEHARPKIINQSNLIVLQTDNFMGVCILICKSIVKQNFKNTSVTQKHTKHSPPQKQVQNKITNAHKERLRDATQTTMLRG